MLWKVAITTTFWASWLERSKRIFEDVQDSIETIWDRIRLWVGIWKLSYKDFKSIPFTLIIRDWNLFL